MRVGYTGVNLHSSFLQNYPDPDHAPLTADAAALETRPRLFRNPLSGPTVVLGPRSSP